MLRILLSMPVRVGLTILLGTVFALLCFLYGWFTSVDLRIYDLGLKIRSGAESASDVVVIAIDRYSREECFPLPHFPISQHTTEHAEVVRRLQAAGAEVIAFDILFDQLDPELDVTSFASALGQAENVILAGLIESQLLQLEGTGASIREERVLLPSAVIPSSSYQLGLVNVPLGSDAVARQSYQGKGFQGRWYPSLPAEIASAFQRKQRERMEASEVFYIDYSSPRRGFVTVPYAQVLKGEGWQGQVEGRIALIGVVENGLSDTHKSPVADLPNAAQGYKLPGVLFLAYATNTLLGDEIIATLPGPYSILLSLFLILGSSFLVLGRRLTLNLALLVLFTLVLLVCGIWLVASNVTILPAGKLMVLWLVTGVMGIMVNFAYTRLKSIEQETKLEEISSDLKMAKQIQQKLQPERIPVMEEAEVSGLQIPCKEIGGDYYDVLTVSDRKVAVLVADVAGKGISGALVMSNFQSVVHSLAPKIHSPSQLFGELNQAVAKIVTAGRFVTFFYGVLDRDTRKFTYSNAGHTYPILCKADGKTSELSEGGLFLGPFPQSTWEEYEIQLQSGDILLIYTDGVTESAVKKTDEQYGEERLKKHLGDNVTRNPKEINEGLVQGVRAFTGNALFDDDLTILTLKIS